MRIFNSGINFCCSEILSQNVIFWIHTIRFSMCLFLGKAWIRVIIAHELAGAPPPWAPLLEECKTLLDKHMCMHTTHVHFICHTTTTNQTKLYYGIYMSDSLVGGLLRSSQLFMNPLPPSTLPRPVQKCFSYCIIIGRACSLAWAIIAIMHSLCCLIDVAIYYWSL